MPLGLANVEGSATGQPIGYQLLPTVLERSRIPCLLRLLLGEANAPSPVYGLGRPISG